MVHGVTYEGEIGTVGSETTPQQAVELVCTDPRFVERASAKKPNFIIRLFNGALSFPRDWWYAATFLSTRVGMFGAEGRAATDATANTLMEILSTAEANRAFALQTVRALMGHLLHYPEFYGRQGTMIATGMALKAAGAPLGALIPVGLLNFFMANLGAMARAVDNGATTLAELVVAAAIGESDPAVTEHVSRQMTYTHRGDDYDISPDDEEYLLFIIRGVLRCLRNPGEAMNNGERARQQVVPVGTVSSARPRGVMGNIPVGYETNALDVISDQNAMFNRN